PKTCTITVRQNNGKTTFSLYVDPMFEGGGIDVWTYGNSAWTRAYKVVTDSIPSLRPTAALANQNYARMGRWALKHFSRKSLEMILRDLTSV
ncbi:MAG: hypothetical protein M0Q93_00970, partial [Terrimicrobiaceae bacterium]|nr:hypothetical protein [Terrimicrobiaceae bacterium]